MIKGLHHNAYRCQDSEETRAFYEDFLDLHIALGVENDVFDRMLARGRAEGIEVRGPVDHGFVRSIYFRDPNGYVIELTASTGKHQEIMDPAISKPHDALARWQAAKSH